MRLTPRWRVPSLAAVGGVLYFLGYLGWGFWPLIAVFLALFGQDIFAITEKLTSLDFLDPAKQPPFLLQGPFSHVPCQIVILDKTTDGPGLLFTCSRGYARDLTAAILEAGEEFGLHPAGETAFANWFGQLWGQATID